MEEEREAAASSAVEVAPRVIDEAIWCKLESKLEQASDAGEIEKARGRANGRHTCGGTQQQGGERVRIDRRPADRLSKAASSKK